MRRRTSPPPWAPGGDPGGGHPARVRSPGDHLPAGPPARGAGRTGQQNAGMSLRRAFAPAEVAPRKVFRSPPSPRARAYLGHRRPRVRPALGSGGRQQPRAPGPGAPPEHHPAGRCAPAPVNRPSPAPRRWEPAFSAGAASPSPRLLAPRSAGRADGRVCPSPLGSSLRAPRREAVFSPPTKICKAGEGGVEIKREGAALRIPGFEGQRGCSAASLPRKTFLE